MFERKEWRALACRFQVRRPLQPTVTLHADTPSDTLLACDFKAPCPARAAPRLHLLKGLDCRRFRRTSFRLLVTCPPSSKRPPSGPISANELHRFQLMPLTIHRAVSRGPFWMPRRAAPPRRPQSSLGDTGCTNVIHQCIGPVFRPALGHARQKSRLGTIRRWSGTVRRRRSNWSGEGQATLTDLRRRPDVPPAG
jgi:hypothetical protein